MSPSASLTLLLSVGVLGHVTLDGALIVACGKHLLAREVVASVATAHKELFSSAATKWATEVVASIRK